MFKKWFKRNKNKNKYPSVKFTMISDKETKIDVEWPYIDTSVEKNKDLAERTKVSMAQTLAKTIYAMSSGIFMPFMQQRVVQYGADIKDEQFAVIALTCINALNEANGGQKKSTKGSKEPLVKPDEAFDIRNMMLRQGESE